MDFLTYALLKEKIGEGTVSAVSDYLDEHLTNPTNPPIDTSLLISGAAADAKETGDQISQLKNVIDGPQYNITWQQGGLNTSGTAVSRTNRIRTDYITIENDSIYVEIPSGFKYAIHAYNSSKTRIGYISNGSDIITDSKAIYKVSDSYDNAVYFRMWVAYTDDSDILPAEGSNVKVAPFESVIASLKSHVLKSVRILGVGNSYTRDSIRWLCKILKESGYEDVVVGHGYLGASTLAEQYASLDSADSNHSAFEYWKYNNTKNATKTSGKTLDEIFEDEPWDIVVFQQQSDESGQYASYVSSSFDINDFITYISGKVSNADLKFALMMPWSHADGYTSTKFAEYYNSNPKAMLDAIKTVIPQVADHMSQCDYVVNAGEAIDLGRQNGYLNALGDQMLRADKNHLYYGIPSYMVGLVYALTLCDVNLNNVMWYPTATDEEQTGITASGYLAYLAKQCAETAVNGYVLADDISKSNGITVIGTTPTINAETGARYICGEVTSLTFNPCAFGICDVRFTSGTTPTVLTLPQTVKMPSWWVGTEANKTYEISISDGVYGVVMSWD